MRRPRPSSRSNGMASSLRTRGAIVALSKGVAEVADRLAEFAQLVMRMAPQARAEVADEERPTADDVEAALLRYREDYKRAGSHAKRKLLFAALLGEFNPEIYEDGWNRISAMSRGSWSRRTSTCSGESSRPTAGLCCAPARTSTPSGSGELDRLGLVLNPIAPRTTRTRRPRSGSLSSFGRTTSRPEKPLAAEHNPRFAR